MPFLARAPLPRIAPAVLLLPLAVGLEACKTYREAEPEPPWPELEATDLGSMRNVFASGPVWFGGLPAREDLDLAARRGVRAVISLCAARESIDFDLQPTCEELGLRCLCLRVEGDRIPDDQVDLALMELHRARPGELLMFCGTGGRCAALFAIHRAVQVGVPLEEALREAYRAGMKPGETEEFVREQVERLRGRIGLAESARPDTG